MRTLTERLHRLCSPVPEAGCWLWLGATLPSGYGKITVRTGVTEYAHRLSWQVHYGAIPDGHFVCHKCDTPSCVNPEHLFLGTHTENMKDMTVKGRSLFGSLAPLAKLSDEQVGQILRSNETCQVLADRHSVSTSAISLIKTGQRWRHKQNTPLCPDQEQAA